MLTNKASWIQLMIRVKEKEAYLLVGSWELNEEWVLDKLIVGLKGKSSPQKNALEGESALPPIPQAAQDAWIDAKRYSSVRLTFCKIYTKGILEQGGLEINLPSGWSECGSGEWGWGWECCPGRRRDLQGCILLLKPRGSWEMSTVEKEACILV